MVSEVIAAPASQRAEAFIIDNEDQPPRLLDELMPLDPMWLRFLIVPVCAQENDDVRRRSSDS
jgi:hypothetical protein